jgi:large subunit ribosomal protein L25
MTAQKQISIKIAERKNANTKALRTEGNTPAVFYGPQEEATAITLNTKEFTTLWKQAGESTIIVLKGVGDDKEVLIKGVQWHPLTDEVMHVDFYAIERGKLLTVSVPLEFVGEAPAEKLGGNVNKVMHELEIEVKPSEIPQSIEVDLTALTELSSTVTVGDLKLPESATPTFELTDAVASVSEAVEEDLSAPVGEAMAEEPEEEGAEGSDDAEGEKKEE